MFALFIQLIAATANAAPAATTDSSTTTAAAAITISKVTLSADLQKALMPINMPFTAKSKVTSAAKWTGADVAASIKVGEDKYVWLFGDSTSGTLFPNKTRSNYGKWPRNTVSISSASKVSAVYSQSEANCLPDGSACADSLFKPAQYDRMHNLIWLYDGLYMSDTDTLYMVGNTIEDGLYPSANTLVKVASPNAATPQNWKYELVSMSSNNMTTLSRGIIEKDGYVYVFGDRGAWQGIVSRLPSKDFKADTWSGLEYLMSDDTWSPKEPQTAADLASLKLLYSCSGESKTVYSDQLKFFVKFFVDPTSLTDINMYTSPAIEGPWVETKGFSLKQGEYAGIAGLNCYAVKIHPELAAKETEMVISVNCQGGSLSDIVDNGETYIPIFYTVAF